MRSLLDEAQRMVREPGLTWYATDVSAALAEVGEVDAAEAVFSLVSLTDRSADVRLRQLATGYARNGDLARTRQTIARIRGSGQRQLAWLQAGQTFSAARRFEETREALQRAIASVAVGEYPAYHDAMFLAEVAEEQRMLGDAADAADTFARAVKTASLAGEPWMRLLGLSEVAARQAKLGLLQDALDTADRVQPEDRESAWRKIVETLAASGHFDDARQVSEKINRPWTAASAALTLSDAYVRAGRLPDARELLHRAEAVWPKESDAGARVAIAMQIATSHGTVGNREDAAAWLNRAAGQAEATTIPSGGPGPFAILREIETVPGASARQGQFRGIAVAQARLGLVEDPRQSFKRALVAAQGHQPGVWQKTAVWVVAKSQAEAGLPDDAIRTMETLPEADRDWLVYVEIASAMACAGRVDEALRLVHARGGGVGGMSYVAEALLKGGDLKNALTVALQGSGSRFVLRSIAQRYALTGDVQPVLDALKNLRENEKRMPLFVGMVDGLLERSRATSRATTLPSTFPTAPQF